MAAFSDRDGLGGTMKLIAVAERALHLWEYLRVEYVRLSDPDHVESALDDARASLRTNRDRDHDLVTTAAAKLESLREIGPLETHHLLSIPDLQRQAGQALDALEEFAATSRTELPTLDRHVHRPGLIETRTEVKRQAIGAKDGAVKVSKAASHVTSRSAKNAASRVTRPLRGRQD